MDHMLNGEEKINMAAYPDLLHFVNYKDDRAKYLEHLTRIDATKRKKTFSERATKEVYS
jgi:hypothetical protein